jgi:hypothetical protein
MKLVNEPADQRSARGKVISHLDPDQRWSYEINTWVVVAMVYALVLMYQIVSGLLAIRRRWRHWKARKGGAKYHKVATKPPSRN